MGWYQANAGLKDTTLHENVVRVADVIRRNSGEAVVFIVKYIIIICLFICNGGGVGGNVVILNLSSVSSFLGK